MAQGKDRWDPKDALSGAELARKQREIANVMRDVVRDRYNPTLASPSMYRDPSPRSGGEPYINGQPARLVEAAQKAEREDAERTDRWRAFREKQERDFEAAKAKEPWLSWDAWIKRNEREK